jgi:hypothetical protein
MHTLFRPPEDGEALRHTSKLSWRYAGGYCHVIRDIVQKRKVVYFSFLESAGEVSSIFGVRAAAEGCFGGVVCDEDFICGVVRC